jgi:hypothetical protein
MKIPPMRSILLRDFAYIRRLSKKIKMKKAQGLKLSIPPRIIVNNGRDQAVMSIGPKGV